MCRWILWWFGWSQEFVACSAQLRSIPQPMMTNCWPDTDEQTPIKLKSHIFFFRGMFFKVSFANIDRFVLSSICWLTEFLKTPPVSCNIFWHKVSNKLHQCRHWHTLRVWVSRCYAFSLAIALQFVGLPSGNFQNDMSSLISKYRDIDPWPHLATRRLIL